MGTNSPPSTITHRQIFDYSGDALVPAYNIRIPYIEKIPEDDILIIRRLEMSAHCGDPTTFIRLMGKPSIIYSFKRKENLSWKDAAGIIIYGRDKYYHLYFSNKDKFKHQMKRKRVGNCLQMLKAFTLLLG